MSENSGNSSNSSGPSSVVSEASSVPPPPRPEDYQPRPCGACRAMQRRCRVDCFFAPYFPSTNPHRFRVVRNIFGARNLGRMLRQLPPYARRHAANALVVEAEMRVRQPILGPLSAVINMHSEIQRVRTERDNALNELAAYQFPAAARRDPDPNGLQLVGLNSNVNDNTNNNWPAGGYFNHFWPNNGGNVVVNGGAIVPDAAGFNHGGGNYFVPGPTAGINYHPPQMWQGVPVPAVGYPVIRVPPPNANGAVWGVPLGPVGQPSGVRGPIGRSIINGLNLNAVVAGGNGGLQGHNLPPPPPAPRAAPALELPPPPPPRGTAGKGQ